MTKYLMITFEMTKYPQWSSLSSLECYLNLEKYNLGFVLPQSMLMNMGYLKSSL